MLLKEVYNEAHRLFGEYYLERQPPPHRDSEKYFTIETFGGFKSRGYASIEYLSWNMELGDHYISQGLVGNDNASNMDKFLEWCRKTLKEILDEEEWK